MSKKTLVFAILLSIICLLLVGCSDREMTDITISVETNGGTSVPTYATVILEAPKTTKQGFYFDNWYKDAALTERITFPYAPGVSSKIYAKWLDPKDGGSPEIEYTISQDGTGYYASKYEAYGKSVVIPDQYKGLNIIGISSGFLQRRSEVERIYIGKNIQDIKESFYRCSILEEYIVDESNVTFNTQDGALYKGEDLFSLPPNNSIQTLEISGDIEENALRNCLNLKYLILGDEVTRNDNNFKYLDSIISISVSQNNDYYSSLEGILYSKNRKELINAPCNKTYEDDAFSVPISTEIILDNAFKNSKIVELHLPSSVTTIGDISDMSSLRTITVESDNTSYKSENGVLYSKDGKKIIAFPSARIGVYSIEDNCEEISTMAFGNCMLATIYISSSVKKIDYYAFYNSSRLEEIIFDTGSAIEEIAESAFAGCGDLKLIEFTSRVAPTISENTFSPLNKNYVIKVPVNAGEYYKFLWDFNKKHIQATGLGLEEYTATFKYTVFSTGQKVEFRKTGAYILENVAGINQDGYIFSAWYNETDAEEFSYPYALTKDVVFVAIYE